MKKLFLIVVAALALVIAHDFSRVFAWDHDRDRGHDDRDGIPLSKITGKYATVGQGSVTICFKPGFTATESCSAADVIAVPGNSLAVGQSTGDEHSNCASATTTFGFPGDKSATTGSVQITVSKLLNYDPATGSGDSSFTIYTGGKCKGANFDSTGATVINTGTFHFVASNDGKRVDDVITTLTDPIGDIGAFNLSGFTLKQKE